MQIVGARALGAERDRVRSVAVVDDGGGRIDLFAIDECRHFGAARQQCVAIDVGCAHEPHALLANLDRSRVDLRRRRSSRRSNISFSEARSHIDDIDTPASWSDVLTKLFSSINRSNISTKTRRDATTARLPQSITERQADFDRVDRCAWLTVTVGALWRRHRYQ